MKTKGIKQFVIYSRKSKFTGKGESIENQIEMCRQYIAMHYGQEEATAALVYEDEGFSGGTLERPQFKKMMKDSQELHFDAIVVYRLDRISRNIGDFAKLIEDLGNRQIDFISIREQFDTSSPMGRAMMYIASVFSQLERETIAERIRDNMHELSKTGRWLGGTTPTGYESESVSTVTVDGKTRKACKLKIIPEEIHLVNLIYDKFLETGSLTKTDQFLLQGHYRTKRGKRFTRFAIKGILSNPVYMIADEDAYQYLLKNEVDLFSEKDAFDGKYGVMAYNRTLQRPGKAHQEKPMQEWIVSVGKHKGVISGEKWVQVQKLLERNKSKSYRKPRSNVALLSGILFCGNCGDYMRPKLSDRLNAAGNPIYTYLCTTKERSCSHNCKIKNVNGNLLDAKVIATIQSFGKQNTDLANQISQAKKQIYGNREGYDAEVAQVKSQIEENEKEIQTLVISLGKAEGTHAEQYILEQIEKLHGKGEALQKHLAELETMLEQHDLADIEFNLIRQMLSTMGDNIAEYSVEQKRAVIRTLIRKIVWDGENVHLYLYQNEDDYKFPNLSASCDNPCDHSSAFNEPLGEDSK
ncbi:MAG: recombinase family protein [Candidatus Merdivicinus sp.]|jgi:DNA invertase Pin-like site-specific DNA recombinase